MENYQLRKLRQELDQEKEKRQKLEQRVADLERILSLTNFEKATPTFLSETNAYLFNKSRKEAADLVKKLNPPHVSEYQETIWGVSVTKNSEKSKKRTSVRFCIHKETVYGESIYLCGASEELGEWKPELARSLRWTKGHIWQGDINLPQGTHYYRYFLYKESTNTITWNSGDWNVLTIKNGREIKVVDKWNPPVDPFVLTPYILADIFMRLSVKDAAYASMTCKKWHDVIQHPNLIWRKRCRERCGCDIPECEMCTLEASPYNFKILFTTGEFVKI